MSKENKLSKASLLQKYLVYEILKEFYMTVKKFGRKMRSNLPITHAKKPQLT